MDDIRSKILRNLGISYIKRSLKLIDGPVFVSIFFTRECNLNCYYCSTTESNNKLNISLKKWKNIINQLYNEGCRFITIYGGEPTLRSDLGDLLKHCIDLGIYTHIVTNGLLINEELLEEFTSYGYFILGIGIDCLSETYYSQKVYRPDLIELLAKFKKENLSNIDYTIHILTNRYNISELIPLISKINSKLKDCRFSIDPVHSALNPNEQYQFRSHCPDLLLKKETITILRNTIQNLKRLGIKVWSPNMYYYFMNKWYYKKYEWNCDAGDLYYAIDNDGTVMLCEDVNTNIPYDEFMNLDHKKRVKLIKKFKFKYCSCFKPCYWNPTNFVKHPIKNVLYTLSLK